MSVGKSGETFNDTELQRLSDDANETIAAWIKVNQLPAVSSPPRISSLFNFNKLNLLPARNTMESDEDEAKEIENVDVIEIEVPVIGNEFMRKRKESDKEEADAELATSKDAQNPTEINIFVTSDLSVITTESHDILTFPTDVQTFDNDATSFENVIETTTHAAGTETLPAGDEATEESQTDDIQSVESKLMEQWKADDNMIDGSSESKMFTIQSRAYPKYPFNVKIVVNNEDEWRSCKSKTSCSQVSFARSKNTDIDPEFYVDYSDEDLFFKSEPDRYFKMANELRPRNARRAADDMFTPAPRFPPLRGIKKPSFLERLEQESSLERSERINKNIDGLMRFISVWAQVDRFVSDRTRGAIKRIAYLAGDDDYADDSLGSKQRKETKRMVADPFT